MPDTRELSINDLADRVFRLPEKWGWEYQEPVPVRRSPEWEREPLWVEPTRTPGIQRHSTASPKRIVVVVVILIIGLGLRQFGILLDLLAIVLAGIWFLPAITNASKEQSQQRTSTERRDQEHAKYKEAWQAWRTSVESWNTGERARIDAADLWFPVTADQAVSRIDVFGGTADGWAALITTLGASLLAAGRFALILDLSEHDVSSELVEMARLRGIPADVLDLPSEAGYASMLAGLGPEDVAEIIAEAVNTSRETGSAELRSLDAALVRSVAARLQGRLTFRRIGAGLQVLRRTYDGLGLQDPPLSENELLNLSSYVDAAGQDDQTQRELQFLINSMELLAGSEAMVYGRGMGGDFWPRGTLVIRTSHHNSRRKDLADRVPMQILMYQLRMRGGYAGHGAGSLIIVGCDHIGLGPWKPWLGWPGGPISGPCSFSSTCGATSRSCSAAPIAPPSSCAWEMRRSRRRGRAYRPRPYVRHEPDQPADERRHLGRRGQAVGCDRHGVRFAFHGRQQHLQRGPHQPGPELVPLRHVLPVRYLVRTVNRSTTNTVTDGATVSRVYGSPSSRRRSRRCRSRPSSSSGWLAAAGTRRRRLQSRHRPARPGGHRRRGPERSPAAPRLRRGRGPVPHGERRPRAAAQSGPAW